MLKAVHGWWCCCCCCCCRRCCCCCCCWRKGGEPCHGVGRARGCARFGPARSLQPASVSAMSAPVALACECLSGLQTARCSRPVFERCSPLARRNVHEEPRVCVTRGALQDCERGRVGSSAASKACRKFQKRQRCSSLPLFLLSPAAGQCLSV